MEYVSEDYLNSFAGPLEKVLRSQISAGLRDLMNHQNEKFYVDHCPGHNCPGFVAGTIASRLEATSENVSICEYCGSKIKFGLTPDYTKIRRRLEEWLRKRASKADMITLATALGINLE